MNLHIHPYFKDRLLFGRKSACLTQENFTQNEFINFLSIDYSDAISKIGARPLDSRTPKIFATAYARNYLQLFLDSNFEKIEVFKLDTNSINHGKFYPASQVEKQAIVFAEGFDHMDDFWKSIHAKGQFKANQIYFHNLQKAAIETIPITIN